MSSLAFLSWAHGYSAQVFRQLDETDTLNTVSTKSLTMNDEWSIVVSEYAMYLERTATYGLARRTHIGTLH